MNKLILIEGIPGSGKTTTSRLVFEALKDKGHEVFYFTEGDLHPADLSWQSILTVDDFNKLLSNYLEYENILKTNTVIEDGYAITAYTLLGISRETSLYKYLASHEIYSINADLDTFKTTHLTRWKKFVENINSDTIYVFECVLLQNHITQLILEYEASEDEIKVYFQDFIDVIKVMNPVLHYLSPVSADSAIRHVAKVRRPEYQDRNNVWIDRVIDYIATTPYGIRNEIVDLDSYIQFSSHRQEIEKRLINEWIVDVNVIEHNGLSWDRVLEKVLKHSIV